MSRTKQLAAALAAFGWPPVMEMPLACGFTNRSPWTLRRAVQRNELPVAGRRGRSMTFFREDLERWMLGLGREGESPPRAVAEPTRATSTSGDALARLRVATRGGR